jgi:hypothetical protein
VSEGLKIENFKFHVRTGAPRAWLVRFCLVTAIAIVTPSIGRAADRPSFEDLLARAQAQAASGHRWSPPGDNMTETISAMMDLISTATPKQLADLSALLEGDSARASTPKPQVPRPLVTEAAITPLPVAPDRPLPIALEPVTPQPPPAVAPEAAAPNPPLAMAVEPVAPKTPPAIAVEPVAPKAPPAVALEAVPPKPPLAIAVEPVAPKAPPAVAREAVVAKAPPAVALEAVTPKAPPAAALDPVVAKAAPAIAVEPVVAKAPPAVALDPVVAKTPPAPVAIRPSTRAADLFARGQEAERQGDVSGARRLYATAADQGSATAARSLGRLYDPGYLKQTALGGIDPDPALARRWYERAVAMGDTQATPLLQALAAR